MRKRTVIILKIIAVIVVALSLLYAVAVGVSSAKLRRAYADLKKDGRPMRQADVIPPEVPDSENAALLYESAALLLKAQPAPEGNLLEYLGALSDKLRRKTIEPDELAEFQQLIEQDAVTQAISIVEQGAERSSCRFDRDYNAGINILMPEMPIIRHLSFILTGKARLEARAGNTENAWKIVLTHLRFADDLRNEPIIVPQLVRIASFRLALKTIQEICTIAPPNDRQYRSIRELIAGFDDIAPMVLAVDGERLLLGEWAFNLSKNELYKVSSESGKPEDIQGIIYRLITLRITFKPLFLADHAAYLRFMHKTVRFIEDPYSTDQTDDMEKQIQDERHILTRIILPAINRVKVLQTEMIAELRITQAGLALLQYKQDRDAFPAALDALELQNINDPFSGGPLRYERREQGFVIYSIGPDQKDNAGSPKQKKQKEDWDIVWTFPGES